MNKKNIAVFSASLFIVFLDQLTKILVKNNFQLNESIPVIKDVLHLTYITNTGAAFGLLKGLNILFIIFSIIVVCGVFHYVKRIGSNERLLQFSIGMLLGGTTGNLIDRLAYGSVIDFIDFRVWPVFNFADSAVTISIILLIIVKSEFLKILKLL